MRLTTAVADQDLAVADLLEPGDHPQQRRLAAARWADQHRELAVGDVDVDAMDARSSCRIAWRRRVSRLAPSEVVSSGLFRRCVLSRPGDFVPSNTGYIGRPVAAPLHDIQRRLAAQFDLQIRPNKRRRAASAVRADGGPADASGAERLDGQHVERRAVQRAVVQRRHATHRCRPRHRAPC